MKTILAILALALGMGCANGYYSSYRELHPDWRGAFPAEGASLHETLAGLHGPRTGGRNRIVAKLDVLALRDGAFEKLTRSEVGAALANPNGTYAVVATEFCHSEVGEDVLIGEKVSWFLLPEGRLSAYDAHHFTDDLCTVSNDFSPAASHVDLERRLIAYRDAHFPTSMIHLGEVYRKGLLYAERDRLDDARAMLDLGDSSYDVADRGTHHVEGWQPTQMNDGTSSAEIERLRQSLIEVLEWTEARTSSRFP